MFKCKVVFNILELFLNCLWLAFYECWHCQILLEMGFLLCCSRCIRGQKISVLWKPLEVCICFNVSNQTLIMIGSHEKSLNENYTSTMKWAHVLLLRFSITPFRMVNSKLLITCAISRNRLCSLHSICIDCGWAISITNLQTIWIAENCDRKTNLDEHVPWVWKIFDNYGTDKELISNFKSPSGAVLFAVLGFR